MLHSLWVLRESEKSKLPVGFADEIAALGTGLVMAWCSQLEVLAHRAVGCFMTHSSWNLELDTGGLVPGSSVGDDGTADMISLPMLSSSRMCERSGPGSRWMARRRLLVGKRLRPVLASNGRGEGG